MIVRNRAEALENIVALRYSLDGKSGRRISPAESLDGIKRNVGMVCALNPRCRKDCGDQFEVSAKSHGSGLLLTNSGFMLTAYHNIADYLLDWDRMHRDRLSRRFDIPSYISYMGRRYVVSDQDHELFPIDVSFRAVFKEYDLALIKAIVPVMDVAPNRFMTCQQDVLWGDAVAVHGLRSADVESRCGFVRDSAVPFVECQRGVLIHDTYLTDIEGTYGYSGAPVVHRGCLAGVALYIRSVEGQGPLGCAKVKYAKRLIESAVNRLERGRYIIEL